MSKLLRCAFLVLTLFFAPIQANAGLKIDATSGVGRTVNSVKKFFSDTQEKVNKAAKDLQAKINGTKVPAMIETGKALAGSVKETYAAGESLYSETMSNVGELTDEYEATMEEFEKSELGKSKALAKQQSELDVQIKARQEAITEELTAKHKAAQQNYETLQEMYKVADDPVVQENLTSEMAHMQNEIQKYDADLKQISSGEGTYLEEDSEYKSLIGQREQVIQQLVELGGAAALKAAGEIEDLLSQDDAQKAKEYNKVIEDNFLKPDEPENAESVKRIVENRQKVLLKDIVYAFTKAVNMKQQLDADLDETIKFQENIAAVDQKMTSGNLLIQQRILDTKILYNYTDLMIAEMRLKTAQNMANQDYRLKNYDKNPVVLDLDSYIFKEKDVKTDAGKKSFLNNVKSKRKKK